MERGYSSVVCQTSELKLHREGLEGKVEYEFIKDRYVVDLQNLSEEEFDSFAGIMGPYNFKQISGDGLEEPIEIVNASTAFQMQGIPTEKANYKIWSSLP